MDRRGPASTICPSDVA
ncbi:hypothetical protein ABTX85_10970 [Streptomyces sp. NPDC096097]